jgi:DNA-binding XRE family transcriptional regulator
LLQTYCNGVALVVFFLWFCSTSYTKGGGDIIKIADIRKSVSMTQEQLAKESGVHRVTIARYETGATSPTVRSLEKIAAALNVPVSDLVDGKGALR